MAKQAVVLSNIIAKYNSSNFDNVEMTPSGLRVLDKLLGRRDLLRVTVTVFTELRERANPLLRFRLLNRSVREVRR